MKYTIADVFKGQDIRHHFTLFLQPDIDAIEALIFDKGGKPYIKCLASGVDRAAKPEEIVRQLWLRRIINEYGYPATRIQIEKHVQFGSTVSDKRADIVITRDDYETPYIIFEVKKPKRKDGEAQLKSYCNAEGSPIGVWSNGQENIILHRDGPNAFVAINHIPSVGQTLTDVLKEPWTLDRLIKSDKLTTERLSLKALILSLEDMVLANAEGIDDSFSEVFKLIYAKLFDEWAAASIPQRKRELMFRIYDETPDILYDKINNLFKEAQKKWKGVFTDNNESIKLKPEHLKTCVSFLQDVKLFNATLQVIDEAFEYLITEVAKGKKGQYFTPRHVIDMCVKMLNPKRNETVIDTACGSSGFTVHSLFHVAGKRFPAGGFEADIVEYARENVYAIDTSPRAVKVAKALHIIAGDGKSNVYEANSLYPPGWNATVKAGLKDRLADGSGANPSYQDFDFDLVMTNPPFAGNVSKSGDGPTLKQYKLAEKNGKTVDKIGRDILFIERNLRFLKPGGRMAIVLPQGRLNNTSDLYIRNFLFDRARLLAVVGLHGNTFKPHTGTKTSVLFLQKYTDEEIQEIRDAQGAHESEWETHAFELGELLETRGADLSEEDVSPLFAAHVSELFDAPDAEVAVESDDDETAATSDESANLELELDEDETDQSDELRAKIESLETKIGEMKGRAAGKKALQTELLDTRKALAGLSFPARASWFYGQDDAAFAAYRAAWLQERAAAELDYPVFFAVSEQGGKNNSGDPIYSGIQDGHGHEVILHDLHNDSGLLPDGIAEAFLEFAQEQDFDFWRSY